jgi:hypothetical protein
LGFPIPQLVLAETKGLRGQFLVLDGKQRLLTLLQFTGNAEGPRNGFRLSGLEVRTDLLRKTYSQFESEPERKNDFNAFLNSTIRTVVIRTWPNTTFLHTVFRRLNTGSVKLSPQELRQAVVPGQFTDYIDDTAAASRHVQTLLGRGDPDPRMRDVELMVRYLAYRRYINEYSGRIKDFLDETCVKLNETWNEARGSVYDDIEEFNSAVDVLVDIFGVEEIARKPGSRSFNRAIFDSLVFYGADEQIRIQMRRHSEEIRRVYASVLTDARFVEAVESDTAGIPHTFERLSIWGESLRQELQIDFNLPILERKEPGGLRIAFNGFR